MKPKTQEEILEQAKKVRLKEEKKKARKEKWDSLFYYNQTLDISPAQDGSMVRTIRKKRPIFPIAGASISLILFIACFFTVNYDSKTVLHWDEIGGLFSSLFTPNKNSLVDSAGYWNYLWNKAVTTIWSTTEMCFIGTLIGSIISIPVFYLPMFFANFLYTFEINIRASVILGYVGAGGYGYLLQQEFGESHYDCIGALLIPLFIEVILLQVVSNILSRKSR